MLIAILISGCSSMPQRELMFCDKRAPEISKRADPVRGIVERIRVLNLGQHCHAQLQRLRCEWSWGK
jgi:hypothetical protein